MAEQDSKGKKMKGLEKEIDHAIDSLFVEKGVGEEKAPSGAMGMASTEPVESPEVELELPVERPKSEKPTPRPLSGSRESEGGERDPEVLEKDIDDAIDSLFVEKGVGEEKAPSGAMGMASTEPVESAEVKPEPRVQDPRREKPSPVQESVSQRTDSPTRNLENLETHLLSLEWEISRDVIGRVISELGFVKEAYRNNRAIFQVVEIMDRVAHSLIDDEGNITPESLRFLLEAKNGIKLLRDELKDKEDYKNMILSGILARYQLMQSQGETPDRGDHDSARERDFATLARDLKKLSRQLQVEIRQLGAITKQLQARRELSAASEMVETILVESSGRVFAIEKDLVLRSVKIPFRMVRTIWKDGEIRIRGTRLPLINVFRLFRLKGRVEPNEKTVVMIKKGGRTLAVLVDRLLQKKGIPAQHIREHKSVAYVRGVVSMGRGRNVYFLDIDRMMVEF